MRGNRVRVLLISSALLAAAGCATGEEWKTWKEHPTHFASGDHLFFSARNGEGAPPRASNPLGR